MSCSCLGASSKFLVGPALGKHGRAFPALWDALQIVTFPWMPLEKFPPSPGIPEQLLQTTSLPSLHPCQHQADVGQSIGIADPLPWLPVDGQDQQVFSLELLKQLEKRECC